MKKKIKKPKIILSEIGEIIIEKELMRNERKRNGKNVSAQIINSCAFYLRSIDGSMQSSKITTIQLEIAKTILHYSISNMIKKFGKGNSNRTDNNHDDHIQFLEYLFMKKPKKIVRKMFLCCLSF